MPSTSFKWGTNAASSVQWQVGSSNTKTRWHHHLKSSTLPRYIVGKGALFALVSKGNTSVHSWELESPWISLTLLHTEHIHVHTVHTCAPHYTGTCTSHAHTIISLHIPWANDRLFGPHSSEQWMFLLQLARGYTSYTIIQRDDTHM